jgi:ribosomal protein L21E
MRNRSHHEFDVKIFKIGDMVRFTTQYFVENPAEKVTFFGRAGKVVGYRLGSNDPIVYFPRIGRHKEQKFYGVPSVSLEIAK